jgi:hypothetical protein
VHGSRRNRALESVEAVALSASRLALLVQLGTTLPLVGLIWVVQVVVYPQFLHVGKAEFRDYHRAYTRLITRVVGPLMGLELAAAFAWAVLPQPHLPSWLTAAGFVLVLSTWASTVGLAVPRHDRLFDGIDERVVVSLVRLNWLRTVAWSARGALLLWVVWRDA